MKPRASAPIVIASIVVLGVASAWALLAGPLLARVETLAADAVAGYAAAFLDGSGLSLSYERASPRFLGSVAVEGVSLSVDGVPMATADTVRVSYGLAALARASFSVTLVRVEGLSLDASYEGAAALVERIVLLLGPSEPGPAETGRAGPAFEIRDARIKLALPGGAAAEARVKAADVVLGAGRLASASVAGVVTATDPERRFAAARAEIPFSGSLAMSLADRSGSAILVVAALTDLGRLSSQRVSLDFEPAGFSVSAAPSGGLRGLSASWDSERGLLHAELAFEDWSPSAFFAPGGRLAALSPWFRSSFTGSVVADSDLSPLGTRITAALAGAVPLDIAGGKPRVSVKAAGTWESIRVIEASLRNDTLDIGFNGEVSPARLGATGLLSGSVVLSSGISVEGSFELSGSGSSWFAYASRVRAADAELGDAIVSIELGDGAASFYLDAALPYAESVDQVSEVGLDGIEPASASVASRVVVEGSASFGDAGRKEPPYIEALVRLGALRFSSFPDLLAAIVGRAAAAPLSPLSIEGEFSVYSDFSGLSYNASRFLLVYDGFVKGFGVASFSGGLGRLTIGSLDATVAGLPVRGSGSVDYGSSAGISFDADLDVRGLPYALSGAVVDGAVVVTGDYGLRFTSRGDSGSTVASLSVTDMPVPVSDTVSFLSAKASARLASADDWVLVLEDLSLVQPPGASKPLPSIAVRGAFDQSGGRFGYLAFQDAISSLRGTADVTWELGDGLRVTGTASMSGSDGEYYLADGEYRGDGRIRAEVSLRKAPLARLAIPGLRGMVDGDAFLSGSIGDPRARFEFTVNGGQRTSGLPFIAGSGSYEGRNVSLDDTRLRWAGQAASDVSLSYGVDDGAIRASAAVELALGRNRLEGRLEASGSSSAAAAAASKPFQDYRFIGAIENARWTGGELGSIPLYAKLLSGDATISLGEGDPVRCRIGSAGELSLSLSPSLPLSFSAEGRLADGSISLDVADAVVDMPFLFKFIGLPIVKVESGTGRGSLKIRGKALDPMVEGVVEFSDFYLSVPDFVASRIGPIQDPLYFTGGTMETSQSGVPCGDALVNLTLEAFLHGGIPDDVRIAVKTNGEDLVPLSMKLLGMEISGLATADLAIEVNSERARISGPLTMPQGDIVMTTGVVRKKSSSASTYDFTGSLDLSFGKAVKVYFPDKRLPVLSGQADPSSKLAVAFDMGRGEYSIKGLTAIRGGSVFYIQRNFYLKTATIEFDEDSGQFDPKINAEAETRTSTSSGPVVVTLRAVDSRLSSLSFTLDSVPSLPESRILELLGQNLFGGVSDGRLDAGRAIVENLDIIPQFNVASILARNLQTVLGLDLLVVQSQVVQRLLYDLSGLSGTSGEATLADFLDKTAVVGGKYIGDKLFMQVMLSLVADPLASTNALSLDSDISLEWKAPHFTLNWNFQPKNLDSLFIEDQSFSFLWRVPLQ